MLLMFCLQREKCRLLPWCVSQGKAGYLHSVCDRSGSRASSSDRGWDSYKHILAVSPGHREVTCSALSHSPHSDGLKPSGTGRHSKFSFPSVVFARQFTTAPESLTNCCSCWRIINREIIFQKQNWPLCATITLITEV